MQRKKLIEVALPLDAINRAAVRAVIFAQMVDDPSSRPELFPTAQAQDQERQRLFDIVTQLVTWRTRTTNRFSPRRTTRFLPRLPAGHP